MTTLKFTLKTKSYLLTGSGEGDALIDTDVVFHSTGFPFIPGRRVKGLLRESFEEVVEILDENKDIVMEIFGSGGKIDTEGIRVSNLYPRDWGNITTELQNLLNLNKYKHAFQTDVIKKFYTIEIQQTALDENEIAKDRSLRNYRVLNPGLIFEGNLKFDNGLQKDKIELLKKAAINLRFAGTRRNRGFGRIECHIEEVEHKSSKLEDMSHSKTNPNNQNNVPLRLTTLSPIVLALQLGDQNTVFTEQYINGNRLRGMLAGVFMKRKGLSHTDAHKDKEFREIFLSGKVTFGNLFLDGIEPLPQHIHGFKGYTFDKKPPVIVFEKRTEDEKKLITKPVGGYGTISSDGEITKSEPTTTFFFHNSRQDRSAGRSTKDQTEGGIFYYEALDEGQVFEGKISADDPLLLSNVKSLIQDELILHLGKSRSAQYGKIRLEVIESEFENGATNVQNGDYLLILQSPLLLLNDYGEVVPNEYTLKKYLSSAIEISQNDIDIKNAATSYTTIEKYNSVWYSKSGKLTAYKEGSVFLLYLKNIPTPKNLTLLGEWISQGFGKLKWEIYDKNRKYLVKDKNSVSKNGNSDASDLIITNSVLKDIYLKYENEKALVEVKTAATKYAQSFEAKKEKISGHLISRIEQMIKDTKTLEEVNKWFDNIRGKPAEKSLESGGLKEKERKFKFDIYEGDFEKDKTYWLTFFQILRKMKKL